MNFQLEKEAPMGRIAYFSTTYDCSVGDADQDVVLNAGSERGFTLKAAMVNFEPHSMTGSSDELPYLTVNRYTGPGSGGTAGVIFPHTDGDVAAASLLTSPTSLGSDGIGAINYWPGVAGFTSEGTWYLHGGIYLADFFGAEIYCAPGNSLWFRVENAVQTTLHFYEHLTP